MSIDNNSINWDSFYKAFEDRFRGSFEEIKDRLRFYIPILKKNKVDKNLGSVLDLGSGRCEWLELLRDSGISAQGVDMNPCSVEIGIQRKLNIEVGDIFNYLSQIPEESFGAVTAFHVIEHLNWKDQLILIQEAYRVLNPGGVLIIEWPNPESIYVATKNFWIDPTHIKLVPQELLSFMAEFTGFEQIEIKRFRPAVKDIPYKKKSSYLLEKLYNYLKDILKSSLEMLNIITPFLTSGTDIAIIALKPNTTQKKQ
ncbi:MAG: methyltransferase domain-containing protein [Methylomarinum sp.]|nr:methyltransferase domain-containing protein [Methylomarinum sp.]